MRKLDLADYSVEMLSPGGGNVQEPYQVRWSILGVLFSQRNLAAHELLQLDDLGRKVMNHPNGDAILLEEADYQKIRKAFEAFQGFSRMDVELVRRVLNAPEVEVEEVRKLAAAS